MRQARGLLPYAAFAVLVVGATVVALIVSTLGPPAAVPETESATPIPVATAAARPTTDLSPNGRLAYWRSEANGDYLLWLANVDNSRRRSVAKADPSAVSRTRWSADGNFVAYVESGVRLVVVRVDGVTATYTLAPELRADGYRIVDHRFSPNGSRIAATVQRATGSQSDVYLAAPGGLWMRLTTTEDVLAADWVSEEELLVQTTGGIVGRLRAAGRDQLRPLTGMSAATPIVGDDGRVYFLSGRVAPFAGTAETLVFAAASSVWSMTADGEDLRMERTLDADSFRLDGIWPGGYLLHRGTNPAQVAVAKTAIELPISAGGIERLQVSPDKRFAVGFAGTNLVRVEITPAGVPASAVLLLGSIAQGDAWFPRPAALATSTPPKADVPAARYVFALGGHLWTMGADGAPTLLRAGNTNAQTLRRFALPPPQWSPAGDKMLTVESLAPGAAAFQLVAVTIARDGTVRRYLTPSSVGPIATWSPDGAQLAVVALPASAQDQSVVLPSELGIALIDAAAGITTSSIPGREAYWTKAGLVVLSNGTWRVGDRARDEQALEIWSSGQKRQITTIAKLIAPMFAGADKTAQTPLTVRGITQTSVLTAAPDGAHLAVHFNFLLSSPSFVFAVIRAKDGTSSVIEDNASDEAWSATGRHIGYTVTRSGFGTAPRTHAIVRDAETGEVVVDLDGRFAGWSPDGLWVYIARPEGLFARRISGGEAVRFSPYGVVVSATKP